MTLLIAAHAGYQYRGPDVPSSEEDAAYYLEMARDPGQKQPAPFGQRFLVPLLVSSTPVPVGLAFLLWTCLLVFLTHLLLYLLCRDLGLTSVQSLEGVFVLATSHFLWYSIYDYTLVDTLTMAALTGAMLAIQRRSHSMFWALTAIGAVNKEVALFLIPVWVTKSLNWGSWRLSGSLPRWTTHAAKAVAATALMLVGLFLSQLARIAVTGVVPDSGPGEAWARIVEVSHRYLLSVRLPRSLFSLLTVSWALLFVNLSLSRRAREFLRDYSLFVLPTLLLIFAASDTTRMLSYLLPVLVPIACWHYGPIAALTTGHAAKRIAVLLLYLSLLLPRFQWWISNHTLGLPIGFVSLIVGMLIVRSAMEES